MLLSRCWSCCWKLKQVVGWSRYRLSSLHSKCEASWTGLQMCVVESWVYCGEAGLSPGCPVRCPAGFYFSLRNCCQASALKSPGDHIVEVAPGHLSSVPVFVNMGLVRQLQVEGPRRSCGPCAPVCPERCRQVLAVLLQLDSPEFRVSSIQRGQGSQAEPGCLLGQNLALPQRPGWLRLSLLYYEGLEGDLPMFVFPKETPRIGRSIRRYHGAWRTRAAASYVCLSY